MGAYRAFLEWIASTSAHGGRRFSMLMDVIRTGRRIL